MCLILSQHSLTILVEPRKQTSTHHLRISFPWWSIVPLATHKERFVSTCARFSLLIGLTTIVALRSSRWVTLLIFVFVAFCLTFVLSLSLLTPHAWVHFDTFVQMDTLNIWTNRPRAHESRCLDWRRWHWRYNMNHQMQLSFPLIRRDSICYCFCSFCLFTSKPFKRFIIVSSPSWCFNRVTRYVTSISSVFC